MTSTVHTRLTLHGYPTVRVDGRIAPLKLKHALALLALLADHAQAIGRDRVAVLLWPDAEARVGRTRLRRLVHEVQALLGVALVQTTPDTLQLAPSVGIDLVQTRTAMRAVQQASRLDLALLQPLTQPAAALWLDGFNLGSEAFDDWADGRRRAHRAGLARVLEHAAGLAVTQRDVQLAETTATALLALDSCSEAGHAARMQARGLRHDAAGVETAYFECAERLRQELGLRPSPALEAIYVQAAAQAHSRVQQPVIRYAPTAHGQVAYAAWGRGEQTIVVLWGIMSNLEVALDEPRARALLDALAVDHRVVMLDRRGSGLSERVGVHPGAAAAAEDLVAVLDHLGTREAWLFGSSVGGTLALDFALRHPDRTAGLLLYGTSASGHWSARTPWALRPDRFDAWVARLSDPQRSDEGLQVMAPSAANDPWVRDWFGRLLRNAGTRLGTIALLGAYQRMDLSDRLGAIRVPTLLLQRRGDRLVPPAAAAHLAQAIAGAELVELDGDDHFLWHGDSQALMHALTGFTRRHRGHCTTQRLLAA